MKWFYGCFVLCFAALLTGCTTKTFVIMDDYSNIKELKSKQLGIAPYTVTLTNKTDIVNDIAPGVAEDVYKKLFESEFPADIKKKSHIDSVRFLSDSCKVPLSNRELAINKKEFIRIALPQDSVTIGNDSNKAEYILFLSNFSTSTTAATAGSFVMGPNGGGMMTGGTPAGILHQTEFAIWDNTKGKLISYGRVDAEVSYSFLYKSITIWKDGIEQLASEILKASPFRLTPKR
jgi:hypothetical protein